MAVVLYPFQQHCVDVLGDPDIAGRLIADEPGLGKTYECLAIDQRLRTTFNHGSLWSSRMMRTLIIAPWSVHEMWTRKVLEFNPKAKVVIIDRKKRHLFAQAVAVGRHDYYICHYEALYLKNMETVKRVQWFHVIADEIHRVKNPKAKCRLAVESLKTRYKTGASASIADDKPQDIWAPLHWVAPKQFPSGGVRNPLKRFITDWCATEDVEGRWLGLDAQGNDRGHEIHQSVVGMNSVRLPQFRAMIAPYYIRRLKNQVGLDLPEKYYTVVNVPLLPRQRKVYDQLHKEFLAWIGENENQKLSAPKAITRLVRLQQAALATMEWYDLDRTDPVTHEHLRKIRLIEPSAKLDALVDWLSSRAEQVVIFSQSRSMVEITGKRLEREGLSVGLYTGAVSDADKDLAREQFQAGKLDVFAGTIKAGGESITLTAASTVIFLDRCWSPNRNKQAEDRCHRIGQTCAVEVVDFYAPNTVDSKVRKTNINKWSALKALLGES
jgi:SNF2 family DNA or RNA helicase